MRTTVFFVALLLGLVVAPRSAAQQLPVDVMGPELAIVPPATGPLRGDQWLGGAAAIDADLLVAYRDEQAGVLALPLDALIIRAPHAVDIWGVSRIPLKLDVAVIILLNLKDAPASSRRRASSGRTCRRCRAPSPASPRPRRST